MVIKVIYFYQIPVVYSVSNLFVESFVLGLYNTDVLWGNFVPLYSTLFSYVFSYSTVIISFLSPLPI